MSQIRRPAYIEEKTGRSVTQYIIQQPVRKEESEKKEGRITVNYSQTTTTEFAAMAGLVMEKDPIVFECSRGNGDDAVVVKGYCSANKKALLGLCRFLIEFGRCY